MWVRFLGWADPRKGLGNPLQYSCLENPMAEEVGGLVHGVTKSARQDFKT